MNPRKLLGHHVAVIVVIAVVVVRVIVRRVLVLGDGLFGAALGYGGGGGRSGLRRLLHGRGLRGERPRLLRGRRRRRHDHRGLGHAAVRLVEAEPDGQRGVYRFGLGLDQGVQVTRPQVGAGRRSQRFAGLFVRPLVVTVVRVELGLEVLGEVLRGGLELRLYRCLLLLE